MNILCEGAGSPTVVLEAGLGDQVRAWATVQPLIAQHTHVCSYDRAGLGFSDPSSRPGTTANAVDDLHRLLTAADIAPPYVLVGHSLGGMYVRYFYAVYPSEVIGLVLVDPVSEEQSSRYFAFDPSIKSANDTYVASIRDRCVGGAAAGFQHDSELYALCIGSRDPNHSDTFHEAYVANRSRPEFFQATWSEWVNVFTTSSDELRETSRSLGDLPLIVLTREPLRRGPNETQEMRDAKNRIWLELHATIAALSNQGVNRIIDGAGHFIQFDQPEIVEAAILEVLSNTRSAE